MRVGFSQRVSVETSASARLVPLGLHSGHGPYGLTDPLDYSPTADPFYDAELVIRLVDGTTGAGIGDTLLGLAALTGMRDSFAWYREIWAEMTDLLGSIYVPRFNAPYGIALIIPASAAVTDTYIWIVGSRCTEDYVLSFAGQNRSRVLSVGV